MVEPTHGLPQGYVGVSHVIMQSSTEKLIGIDGHGPIPYIGRARTDAIIDP